MQTIREELKTLLLDNYQIGAADFERLFSIFKRVKFDKGEIIIEAEKVSDEIYFWLRAGLPGAIFGTPREMT